MVSTHLYVPNLDRLAAPVCSEPGWSPHTCMFRTWLISPHLNVLNLDGLTAPVCSEYGWSSRTWMVSPHLYVPNLVGLPTPECPEPRCSPQCMKHTARTLLTWPLNGIDLWWTNLTVYTTHNTASLYRSLVWNVVNLSPILPLDHWPLSVTPTVDVRTKLVPTTSPNALCWTLKWCSWRLL